MIICVACPAPTRSRRFEVESRRTVSAHMRESTRTPVKSVKVSNASSRFTRQETGFAAVIITGNCPPQVQAGRASDHGSQCVVAETAAVGDGGGPKIPHEAVVCCHQAEGSNSEDREPVLVSGI